MTFSEVNESVTAVIFMNVTWINVSGDRFSKGPAIHQPARARPLQRKHWHRFQVCSLNSFYSLAVSRPSLNQIPWVKILCSPPVWAAVLANTAYVQVKTCKSVQALVLKKIFIYRNTNLRHSPSPRHCFHNYLPECSSFLHTWFFLLSTNSKKLDFFI